MVVDEGKITGAKPETGAARWETAVDILAARLKQYIGDDPSWLKEFDGLSELRPDSSFNDSPHLDAFTTLLAVWWREQTDVQQFQND